VDSECIWTTDAAACPDPVLSAERTFISCGNAGFDKTWRFTQGTSCLTTGSGCQDIGAQMSNLACTTSQTRDDPLHEEYQIIYVDDMGTPDDEEDDVCIIGELDECLIKDAGQYTYKGMDITWTGVITTADEIITTFEIPYTTKSITPKVICPSTGAAACRGTVACDMIGPQPCGRVVETCDGTYAPTMDPIDEADTSGSSHGDPIIWTFHGECYDLGADGRYLASSHEWFSHDVYISVYNDYMREIQVVDKYTGGLMLSISNLGEIINNSYPFFLEKRVDFCKPHQRDHCDMFYTEIIFDAQDFEYRVQILPHDYLDPALKEGETGIHLDIYPRPFDSFVNEKNAYQGLYFENPLPDILGSCPAH